MSTQAIRQVDNKWKFSRHIVVLPKYSVEGIDIVKRIVDKAIKLLKFKPNFEMYEGLIDTGVYKNWQCFRVPYSRKLNQGQDTAHIFGVQGEIDEEYFKKTVRLMLI